MILYILLDDVTDLEWVTPVPPKTSTKLPSITDILEPLEPSYSLDQSRDVIQVVESATTITDHESCSSCSLSSYDSSKSLDDSDIDTDYESPG